MDNFNNLMELPLLFGVLCLLLAQLQVQSGALLVGAWLYVALRVVHSLIQVSYKRVMHRLINQWGRTRLIVTHRFLIL